MLIGNKHEGLRRRNQTQASCIGSNEATGPLVNNEILLSSGHVSLLRPYQVVGRFSGMTGLQPQISDCRLK